MANDFGAVVRAATAAFTSAPEKASFVFTCDTSLVSGTECSNKIRNHKLVIDEPAELGGTDKGANPVELLLASLAACRAITYQFHAGRLGIPLTSVSLKFSGDLDLRGFLAMDPNIRPGFSKIVAECTVVSDATPEQIAALNDAVAKYCPVADIVENATPLMVNTKVVKPHALAAQ
jgi:uncharacterized OsmC-like protein